MANQTLEREALDEFLVNCELSFDERRRRLDELREVRLALVVLIEKLLAADETPPTLVRALDETTPVAVMYPPSGSDPSEVGPYQIVGRLGTGGMGIVYRARQLEPEREVALKLLNHGSSRGSAMHCFEAEQQILASMNHPGIAQLFRARRTDDGRAYLSMELVDGRSITEFASAHELDMEARMEFFASVCRAVHPAHQRAVLHRDLKPSNILVTEVVGRPHPEGPR